MKPKSPRTEDHILLTPGPLTTSPDTKGAMLHDWGSRDPAFIAMTRRVCDRLLELAGAKESHVVVPIQGSGTFAVEAAVGTLVPRDGKALVLINGEYGRRIQRIFEIIGRAHDVLEWPEDTPPDSTQIAQKLAGDGAISHVIAVHCETTSGILNPIEDIARTVAGKGRRLLVDAMSSFGALPLDGAMDPIDGVMASANKCLEGVPGIGFVVARRRALEASAGNAPSLSLDLHEQWRVMNQTGQWRFTPPTHVVAGLDHALTEHEAEGGIKGRGERYRANCQALVDGMRALGFKTYLADGLQAPIIVTFHLPGDPNFDFETFYDRLRDLGFIIYPGKLAAIPSFRIGCIGHITAAEIKGAVEAVATVIAEMGVKDCAPA
ncbi:MAG: 2-aminoethylphosphonate--pyruvate transaminase [Alphaproteobacteria bacterium]